MIILELGILIYAKHSEKHPALILPCFYVFFSAMIAYAVANRFFSDSPGQVFTFQVVILLMPIVLLDRSWRINLIDTIFFATFIFFDLAYGKRTAAIPYRDDLVNTLVTFLVGILGGRTIRISRLQALENGRIVIVQRDTDELTALPNRRKLFHELHKSYEGRANAIKCLFIADIDFFKKYNDSFGHQAGDEVLKQIGECFIKFGKETGFELFRYGGEEFIGIYRATSDNDYDAAMHHLCRAVHDLKIEHTLPNTPFITISVGYVVQEKAHPAGFEEFITMADNALYEAKNRGRNCTVEYESHDAEDATCQPQQ